MILMHVTGRVGGDATAESINGQFAIKFSVCHSYKYKDGQGNQVDASIWVRCTIWAKNANMAPWIKKGNVVYVSGTPKAHAWLDQDKKIRTQLEMNVKSFEFVWSQKDDAASNGAAGSGDTGGSTAAPPAGGGSTPSPENADDLPF